MDDLHKEIKDWIAEDAKKHPGGKTTSISKKIRQFIIDRGYSRRQELEEDQLIKFYKQWTGGMEPKTQLINFIRAICAKFKASTADISDLTKENEVLREQNLALNKSNSKLVEALGDITRSYHMQHAFDIARQALSNHAKGDGGV